MADWTKVIKPQVEAEISKANLTDKKVIKLILNLERRMNTCRNYLSNGGTWNGMCELKANGDAYYLIQDLREFHSEQWFKYLDANNYCRNSELGDFLA
jgi:hypothetical protein